MKNKIPQGPRYNPHVEDGTYDAVIERVTMGAYGENGDFYVQIICRLTDLDDLYFVSNIYLPNHGAKKSEQRLYHLCSLVGLEKQDVQDQRHLFQKKRLRLQIARIQKPDQNEGQPYYDVDLFLPANPEKPGEEKDETKMPQVKKQAKLKFD